MKYIRQEQYVHNLEGKPLPFMLVERREDEFDIVSRPAKISDMLYYPLKSFRGDDPQRRKILTMSEIATYTGLLQKLHPEMGVYDLEVISFTEDEHRLLLTLIDFIYPVMATQWMIQGPRVREIITLAYDEKPESIKVGTVSES